MHKSIIAAAMLPALLFVAPHAGGDEPQAKSTQAVAKATETKEVFVPPPGFRARKRGKVVVYCRREEPRGTRFPAEVCYDETGIRELLQAQLEDQMKLDQIRRVQATDYVR